MPNPPKWKLFERFVADLERLLDGTEGLEVRSNEKVKDLDGVDRDIDCSVKFKKGATTYFVMIECRRRNGGTDVQWVEQVRTKRDDVRADKAILVHSSKLSKGAMKKAARYNIEFRRLSERPNQTDDIRITSTSLNRISWRPRKVHLQFVSKDVAEIQSKLTGGIEILRSRRVFEAPEFENRVTLPELIDPFLKENDLPSLSGPEIDLEWFTLKSTGERQYVLNLDGHREVLAGLEVQLLILRATVDFSIANQSTYSLPNEQSKNVDQFSLEALGKVFTAAGAIDEFFVDEQGRDSFTYRMAFNEGLPMWLILQEEVKRLNAEAARLAANCEGPFAD